MLSATKGNWVGEGVHEGFCYSAGFGLPDIAQIGFHCRLHGLWEFVHDIGDFASPTPLMSRSRDDLVERLSEPHSPIAGGDLERNREATRLNVDQELAPV